MDVVHLGKRVDFYYSTLSLNLSQFFVVLLIVCFSIPVGAEQQFYFPKYLTSEKVIYLCVLSLMIFGLPHL